MRLQEIPPDRYAAEVLPLTAAVWAGRRDFATYAAQTLEIANGRYGKRHYRTIGFYEGRQLVASFKRYERVLRDGASRLQAIGIGAVFTPEPLRGRGYASAMLATALDAARGDGYDLAYLFSDVNPQFYAAIGFTELPSRQFSLRADALPKHRVPVSPLRESDWPGVRRCFDLCDRNRAAGFVRTPLVWEFLRTRMRHASDRGFGQETNLVVRHGRGVGAYVLGVRDVERDTYVLEEFGFADGDAATTIPALLRSAAGDLRRIAGWLPPDGARELLPKATVRKRKQAVMMAAALSKAGAGAVRRFGGARGDPCWHADHV